MVHPVFGNGGDGLIDSRPWLEARLGNGISGVSWFRKVWDDFAGAIRFISVFVMKEGIYTFTMTRSGRLCSFAVEGQSLHS